MSKAAWRSLLLASTTVGATASAEAQSLYFERVATLPVFQNLDAGADPKSATVAEIVAATEDGMTLIYTDSPGEAVGFVDISDPAAPAPAGRVAVEGEPTSVKVLGASAFVAVDTSPSFAEPSGHVAVIGVAERTVATTCDVGGQPDSVALSPNHAFLAVVVENERDEEVNDGEIPQLPSGHLAIFDLADGAIANCDAARIVPLAGLADIAGEDAEPEFVSVNADNVAVVTLQENNHIALVDLAAGVVTADFPAGAVTLEAVNTDDDGMVAGDGMLENLRREPDAVAWLDAERFVTANEGDYEGGSRGFTIFKADGSVAWDAGSSLEHLGMRIGHYPEDRADNKGVEPEGVEVGQFGDDRLIFVGAERANFVAVYRDTGAAPELLQVLPTAIGPEGLLAIPGRDLFVVGTEEDLAEDNIRATISIYARTAAAPAYPTLVAADDPATGAPIGWGALSGLAADPADANTLYAVSDSAYAQSRIYTIDVSQTPAQITGYVGLTKDGAPVGYDVEGITLDSAGNFWLASEGNVSERQNLLLKVGADGAVQEEVPLPADLAAQATASGFEGVTSWLAGDTEVLLAAIQREWKVDAPQHVRLAMYDPAAASWAFVHYPTEVPSSANGGWVGLSEITALPDGRLAILERDNQPGLYAAYKVITVTSLDGVTPAAFGTEPPLVEKNVAIDLLPLLNAGHGWISDKPEGVAVAADGTVWLIVDNDGVDGASGETQLLRIGTIADLGD